jgi:hypothetical protein
MNGAEEFDVEAEFVDGHNLTSGERFQGYRALPRGGHEGSLDALPARARSSGASGRRRSSS